MIFHPLLIIHFITSFFLKEPSAPLFEAQVIDNKIAIGYGLALGDVDGDKKPDILLADKKAFVWYRNGDWKRFVMIDSLTQHDNVCIAARDINGDGKVEVAVGAQWNPGETTNADQSGSVHYLIRPADPAQKWKAVKLPHEPTVHRMQWIQWQKGKFSLVVVPLHGQGNKGGEGEGVKTLAYHFPKDVYGLWKIDTLEKTMHLTHNFDAVERNNATELYIGGKEGVMQLSFKGAGTVNNWLPNPIISGRGIGEVRLGNREHKNPFIAAIEPMHGHELAVYINNYRERVLLDDQLKEGHALAVADVLKMGSDQVVAGWRVPNKEGKVGIKLYVHKNKEQTQWESFWIDENGMACEDLKVMDLNGDGKLDIIASGRSTHNLVIYWNKQ
jgi:hypothetical protein